MLKSPHFEWETILTGDCIISYGPQSESRAAGGTLGNIAAQGLLRSRFVFDRFFTIAILTTGLSIIAAGAPLAARSAEPRVNLEIATSPDFPQTDIRKWSELLGKLELGSVRIRGGSENDAPEIKVLGKEDSPTYQVVGILTPDKLLLPKARFAYSDRAKIEQWFAKLKEGGIEGVTVKPAAFGLLPTQLVAVHEALAVPVAFSTKDQPPQSVAKRIADGLSLKFITDAAGQRALASEELVADELQGVSSGTALAAIFRPLGLVLVPEKSGGQVRLRIADSRAASEHWPVGWPPKGNPQQTLPDLFKMLNVEIAPTPLAEALPAIQDRLKAPFLLDHNSLARHEINLATKVELPKVNTYYDRILDRLLDQAKLKYELRVDEAEKPLLWITTVKQ
jgi:hypothetical protein